MVHIFLRSKNECPLIIMGETGVGKTLLLEYLIE